MFLFPVFVFKYTASTESSSNADLNRGASYNFSFFKATDVSHLGFFFLAFLERNDLDEKGFFTCYISLGLFF